jgi:UDP:flavonoid glycosyltransferase YjiC (YdhE family)
MVGGRWLKTRLLRRTRAAYNNGNYRASLRRSRLSSLLFRDAALLDISARSALHLNRFKLAVTYYRRANDSGLVLRDHNDNHFRAEFGSGNLSEAYSIASRGNSESGEEGREQVLRNLRKLTEVERVNIIQDIGTRQTIPEDLASLLPWKPKKIELGTQTESYYLLTNEMLEVDRYKRELTRVRQSSPFRILDLLSSSLRSPRKILVLPISLPKLLIRILRERLGFVEATSSESYPIGSRIGSDRECVVLFPTNGVGFGHFTRLLAVAKKMRASKPNLDIVFFTTMPTLHILSEHGFPSYHVSGRYRYRDMPPNIWNSLCEEMLNMVFALHRPRAFVFDGAFPYRGMLNAIRNQEDSMLKVWLRRGAIRSGSKAIPVDSVNHFHAIVRPGDSVGIVSEDELDHGVALVRCNPILLMDSSDMEPPGSLRSRLGIPSEALICYVQLGAGNINDIDSELSMTMDALSKHPQVFIVVGESMLGDRIDSEYERARILRDYPNSRYFQDFDFAILAGGYNSFHEAIEASLPTICFPNMKTGRDDQLARANVAAEAGCMVVIKDRSKNAITAAIDRMVESEVRDLMRSNFQALHRENGAEQVAEWIISQSGWD